MLDSTMPVGHVRPKRIAEEGLLVADPKGVPIPHPAVAIEKSAQEQIRTWGNAFRPRRGGR